MPKPKMCSNSITDSSIFYNIYEWYMLMVHVLVLLVLLGLLVLLVLLVVSVHREYPPTVQRYNSDKG